LFTCATFLFLNRLGGVAGFVQPTRSAQRVLCSSNAMADAPAPAPAADGPAPPAGETPATKAALKAKMAALNAEIERMRAKVAAAASAPPAADADAAEPLVAAAASSRKEMYMVFTCGRCETRAVKGFSRQAYEHGALMARYRVSALSAADAASWCRAGVVLVDCPSCEARHLVADRKGWFGDKGSVEDFLVRSPRLEQPRQVTA
jgi:protein import protein ZIM17